ncbi:hypothetical protein D9615_009959 [Tricholomella constricta]|uniref:ABM domain-containing protein n=1 Tax=Tricholomella constricta TaxID=117010 RepID=A0A8H5LTN7_9AGAR|nr:hypothetical protein D9615_009959 [Tricholomella constricta]
MSVTEFATLQLISPHTLQSDIVADIFEKAGTRQAAYSSYPVHLFTNVADASMVYLISGWKDAEDHMQYMGNEENQKVMGGIVEYLTIKSLLHPVIDFTTFPEHDIWVVTVEKYAADSGAGGLGENNTNLPSAKWAGAGIDAETNEGYKISVYGQEEGIAILPFAGDEGSGISVLRRVNTFRK